MQTSPVLPTKGKVRLPHRKPSVIATMTKDEIHTTVGLTIEFCKRLLRSPLSSSRATWEAAFVRCETRWCTSSGASGLRKRRDALFNPNAFPTVAAVQLKWAEIEKEQAEFVNSATNESLENCFLFAKHRSDGRT
jgi:hypothetical protein